MAFNKQNIYICFCVSLFVLERTGIRKDELDGERCKWALCNKQIKNLEIDQLAVSVQRQKIEQLLFYEKEKRVCEFHSFKFLIKLFLRDCEFRVFLRKIRFEQFCILNSVYYYVLCC